MAVARDGNRTSASSMQKPLPILFPNRINEWLSEAQYNYCIMAVAWDGNRTSASSEQKPSLRSLKSRLNHCIHGADDSPSYVLPRHRAGSEASAGHHPCQIIVDDQCPESCNWRTANEQEEMGEPESTSGYAQGCSNPSRESRESRGAKVR